MVDGVDVVDDDNDVAGEDEQQGDDTQCAGDVKCDEFVFRWNVELSVGRIKRREL